MLTLIAGQPLLTYVLGMITGICGFFGSRSPFITHQFKMMYLFNILNHTMVFFGFLICLDAIMNDSSETQMQDSWIRISSAKARMVICILLGVSNILLHIVSIRMSKPFRNYLVSGF
uniref:AlNc14C3G479 protein n=1 Tax=Albugo laibachii Nc14 TaxID=890382 RepID=F0W001_9STRA|nr:AlNc14C3G479 [Albugo laibachii Nc14]|eukprot:CCA14372.1 AlNc14C3G479 [Albugo laibachii Nc14]